MTSLQWQAATLALRGHRTLVIPELCLTPQACWAFVGSNGSGKTALASALCGELALREGAASGRVKAVRLSFESQQQLGELDWQRRNTDMLGEEEEVGYRVSTLMLEEGEEPAARALLARFGIESLWDRPYRYLSSGEGASCCWPGPCWGAPSCWCWMNPSMGWIRGPGPP
ncbi:ATP-binding cassette domain-containing protein [Aeromonas taiwanensis]|uniref:ATP-binding cassette domain-containing protein n=1 Tax=Aeromonas taiwanensis TaxID=633417 RepID=UPI000ABFAEB0|nr:ATP-binding cassette domain-containing protein [Aeromonas taiwanensis]